MSLVCFLMPFYSRAHTSSYRGRKGNRDSRTHHIHRSNFHDISTEPAIMDYLSALLVAISAADWFDRDAVRVVQNATVGGGEGCVGGEVERCDSSFLSFSLYSHSHSDGSLSPSLSLSLPLSLSLSLSPSLSLSLSHLSRLSHLCFSLSLSLSLSPPPNATPPSPPRAGKYYKKVEKWEKERTAINNAKKTE